MVLVAAAPALPAKSRVGERKPSAAFALFTTAASELRPFPRPAYASGSGARMKTATSRN